MRSNFTHLSVSDIRLCLDRLHDFVAPGSRLFASFFEGTAPSENPRRSHSHRGFCYTREQMEAFGRDHGFSSIYLGEWGHHKSVMMQFVAE